MSRRKANAPTVCEAIARAIDEHHTVKKELARHLGVDASVVTKMLEGRVPGIDTVTKIERYLGLPKGWVFVQAGLVEMPDVKAEELVRFDGRFTPGYARMAELQLRACLAGSAEEMEPQADAASQAERLTPSRMSA